MWKQDWLAEGEVRLVAGCHATTFSRPSFSRVTRGWGGSHGLLVPRCHASTTSRCCRHVIFRAVVFVSPLFHPGPLFGWAQWITVVLRDRASEERLRRWRTNEAENTFSGNMLFFPHVNSDLRLFKIKSRITGRVLTLATQVGQNQSPSGTWVILGLRQYMWQPRSQPSHSNRHSSLSPFLQTWQV